MAKVGGPLVGINGVIYLIKRPYERVTGVITPANGNITLFTAGRGPILYACYDFNSLHS